MRKIMMMMETHLVSMPVEWVNMVVENNTTGEDDDIEDHGI